MITDMLVFPGTVGLSRGHLENIHELLPFSAVLKTIQIISQIPSSCITQQKLSEGWRVDLDRFTTS
jgi:hypothetical protein